jgi:hypothetical protein
MKNLGVIIRNLPVLPNITQRIDEEVNLRVHRTSNRRSMNKQQSRRNPKREGK